MQVISRIFNQNTVIDALDLGEKFVNNRIRLFEQSYSDSLIPAK